MPKSLYLILFALLFFTSCKQNQQAEKPDEAVRFPNEDAPLALLMREMFSDMEVIKASVENGQAIMDYVKKHQEMLSARPTKPEVKTVTFEMMGNAYLQQLEILQNSPREELVANYKVLQETCLACHQQYCPGPMKRINLLKID